MNGREKIGASASSAGFRVLLRETTFLERYIVVAALVALSLCVAIYSQIFDASPLIGVGAGLLMVVLSAMNAVCALGLVVSMLRVPGRPGRYAVMALVIGVLSGLPGAIIVTMFLN